MKRLYKVLIFAALSVLALPTHAQVVGTYTEQTGTVRNQIGVVIAANNGFPVSITNPNADAASATTTTLDVRTFNMVFNGATWDRMVKPNTTSRLLSAAATTNSTLVKAGATNMFQFRMQTIRATPVFVKLYNKATAPTCGTDTPVATYYAPASVPFEVRFDTPLYFPLGLGYCLTAAAADADATALVAGDVVALNVAYQ